MPDPVATATRAQPVVGKKPANRRTSQPRSALDTPNKSAGDGASPAVCLILLSSWWWWWRSSSAPSCGRPCWASVTTTPVPASETS